VEAITNWDVTDGRWLGAPSGLLRKDLSPKPAYDALMALVRGEWWTTETLRTDELGEADFEGFRGDYEAVVRGKGIAFNVGRKEERVELQA